VDVKSGVQKKTVRLYVIFMGRLGENILEVKCTVKEVYFIMHIQWLCCYIYTYIYISHFVLVKTYYCRCNVTKDIIFTDCNLFFSVFLSCWV